MRKDVARLEQDVRDLGDLIYEMTNREIAKRLGKNPNTIADAFKRMGIKRDARAIAWEKRKAGHGQPAVWQKCDCDTCKDARRVYKHEEYLRKMETMSADDRAGALEESRAKSSVRQSRTSKDARSTGKRWTGPEVELALRDDLTIEQIAGMIGRTYAAVSNVRTAVSDPDHPAHARYMILLERYPS